MSDIAVMWPAFFLDFTIPMNHFLSLVKTSEGRAQQGRTLIELLVAIALGLLILLGVGTLYLGANQSTRVATNVASAEETGQIVLAAIGNAIRRAGYAEVVGANWNPSRQDLLYSGPHLQGCVGGEFDLGGGGVPPVVNGKFVCGPSTPGAPDSLAVVFQGDNVVASSQGPTSDCLGQNPAMVSIDNPDYAMRVAGGQMPLVRNIYYLDTAVDGMRNLLCRGSGNPGSAAPLIGNVEDFKVYFGFDDAAFVAPTTNPGNPVARSVRDATYLNGLTPSNPLYPAWDFVVTVHVCVLIASNDRGVTSQTGTATHTPCPQTAEEAAGIDAIVPKDSLTDGRIRRAFSQVFTVRSRAKPAPLG